MSLDLSSLPKFIDGSGKYMWRLPDKYPPTDLEHVYVKLADVEKLLEETVMQDGVAFVSVGMGGPKLMDAAARQGWTLYAYNAAGWMTSGCLGNSDLVTYYIKQE